MSQNPAAATAGVRHDPALLAALRGRLAEQGLSAVVVPHADRYQGEYLPGEAEHLLRLTGFSGSAGTAIVLADTAALCVDGRYTLQAQAEVAAGQFEIIHSTRQTPAGWLAEHVSAGDTVGFDPWLFTQAGIEPFKTALDDRDATLVWLAENPIDALWKDRPPAPSSKVRQHDIAYAGLSARQKRKTIAEILAKAGCEATVLTTGDSVSWLFNIRGDDVPYTPFVLAYAILDVTAKARLFIDGHRLSPQLVDHLGADVEVLAPSSFEAAIQALGGAGKKIRLSKDSAPMVLYHRLEAAGAKVKPGADPCQLTKAIKTPAEISGMVAAHERDGLALTRFLAWLNRQPPGSVDELAAADRLAEFRASDNRFQGPSFPTISGAGANGAIVHYCANRNSNCLLANGALYLVDSGGQYLDGTTDVTRTVLIGTPKPKRLAEMKDRFTRVLKGHIAVASCVFPSGTAGQELDVLARRALWEVGLDYDHGTGHGVGAYLSVHEGPQRIAKRGQAVALAPGMVLSVEPGYYKEGAYGIRIENLVHVVTAPPPKGSQRELLRFEPLTLAPIDRRLVEPAMMAVDEISWLDAYHDRVAKTLAGHLNKADSAWLAAATRPLADG